MFYKFNKIPMNANIFCRELHKLIIKLNEKIDKTGHRPEK